MRRLVLQMGISLDGFAAHPPREGEHEDVTSWKVASLRGAGTHIMGRVAYQEMAAFWPTAQGVYAPLMNDIPKVVFSRTLETAGWTESRIARGELAEEIAELKCESGGDIIAHGGATFAQALSRLGLIDEYRLVIRPVALGDGSPLFTKRAAPLPLELVDARTYPDGIAIHVYQPAGHDQATREERP